MLDAGAGGTVTISPGVYWINAVTGLNVPGNTNIELTGVELRVIPNGAASYNALKITDVSNVSVTGGTLVGDRNNHWNSTGEFGYGLVIRGGEDIRINDMVCKDLWGDGFFIARGQSTPEDIRLSGCRAENNRRQGISILAGNNLLIEHCIFERSNGVEPSCGMDIEPSNVNDAVTNVIVNDSLFRGNKRGMVVHGGAGLVQFIHINRCRFEDNTLLGFAALFADNIHLNQCVVVNSPYAYYPPDSVTNYTLTDCTP